MAEDRLSATLVIDASPAAVFAVLADPFRHAAIDGTGWVCDPLDDQVLSAPGQIFRMAMYHPNHPDGHYQMANRVQIFDAPKTISWEPGSEAPDGTLSVPGWVWRYDLAPAGPARTAVTLTYDWSAVSQPIRDHIGFPPFLPEHLDNSLAHLAELLAGSAAPKAS